MHTTILRSDAIRGLLMGTAFADAASLPRSSLAPRTALAMLGRPTRAGKVIGRRWYGADTQLMLIAAQSVLRSRSDYRLYQSDYLSRLGWYPLGFPVGLRKSTVIASAKSWVNWTGITLGSASEDASSALPALLLTLALNRAGQSLSRWIEVSTRTTHTSPLVLDGCRVLSKAAELAALRKSVSLRSTSESDLEQLIAVSNEPSVSERLSELKGFLANESSPRAVARHFGWLDGNCGEILPVTVLGVYCVLRYPADYSRAVGSAVALGKNAGTLSAVVGGLSGARIGFEALPEYVKTCKFVGPHGQAWIAKLTQRLSHWPHGVDDLSMAPALPSWPLTQVARNLVMRGVAVARRARNCSFRLIKRSVSRHGGRGLLPRSPRNNRNALMKLP
jgi:ADP-ribosylglycohydrolase